jgi:hypothetical protein
MTASCGYGWHRQKLRSSMSQKFFLGQVCPFYGPSLRQVNFASSANNAHLMAPILSCRCDMASVKAR